VIPTLRSVDEAGLVDVLTEMTDKWETDHDARMLWWPARAALDVGPVAHHLVLRAVKKHPDNDSFVVMALSAVEASDPTDDFVLEIADAVLNPVPWDANNLYVEPILTSLVDGVTASNCLERMRMLSYKLKASPDDHFSRRLFRHDQGSVDRPPRPTDHHPFNALLQTYLGCARAALELVPLDELLESMDVLPDDVRYRFRAWAISKSASADTEVITRELAHAIRSRQPTDDDRALINRLTEQDFGDASWQDALGRPPSPADVGRALNERDVPAEWARAYGWSVLLPDDVVSDEWRTAVSILSGSWGPPTTEMFRPHPSVGFESSRSPRDGETLAAMSPESAANWIGRWRSTDWMVTPRELGRTLEEVVKAHPQPWGSNPIRIASLLIHPTYIHHYLAGLSASDALSELDPEKLMQLVSLVRTQPWPVAALGSDSFDYDADWSSAEDACVDLIKARTDADAEFGQSKEAAWGMLVAKIDDRHDESAILDDDTDYLALAINRPSTRALDAALSFLGYEFRSEGAIAENRLDVFTRSLELRGADGAQHRALIVPKIGFLNYVASEWVEQHREELFGAAAPDALGQRSIDLAVKWGLPNAWLMEHFQTGVLDAVRRDVDNALEQVLIAMLGQVPGYQVSKVVQHLRAASLLSEAGESLGRLLRRDDITSQHAEICIDFWRGAIEARGELKGFGWMSEVGAIPDDTWAALTLDTLNANEGRIDWAQEVAKRVDGNEATVTGLAIYNQMVRNVRTPWDYRRICESARSYLARASDQSDSPEYRQLETGLLERGF